MRGDVYLKVLVACECSQVVTTAFRNQGHDAFSCDLQPCYGNLPQYHIQDDVLKILDDDWDLIIAHPPCTYLSSVSNRFFNVDIYGESAINRIKLREEALKFFLKFTQVKCKKVCIENPVGYANTHYRPPDQIINPWYFGDPYEKRTCLWLKGLNPLISTHIVLPEERVYFRSGKSLPGWYARSSHFDSLTRSNIRSKTFPGIAAAMSLQWSENPVFFL